MSDFTHARVCIRHASGSVEIQAAAGETTWLDLSGLHALPVATGKGFRRKRRLLTTLLFLGCSTAVGAGIWFVNSSRPFPAASRAEASALEQAAPQQALLPGLAGPSVLQAPREAQAPALGSLPQPAAHDADPFGLRLK
jgi:hypothetical protein